MPVSTITCPHCTTTFKSKTPVPEGTRLKCPKCTQPFVVPGAALAAAPPKPSPAAVAPKPAAPKPAAAAPRPAVPKPMAVTPKPLAGEDMLEATEIIDDEPDDVVEIADGDAGIPAAAGGGLAAKFPFLKRFPMWVWLTGGGVALLVVLLGCGGVAWLAWSMFGGPSITKDNYDKIKMGSSEKDVTAVLGQPNSSIEDIAKAAGAAAPSIPNGKVMVWKSGDNFIEVGVVKDKAFYKAYKIGADFAYQVGDLGPLLGGR